MNYEQKLEEQELGVGPTQLFENIEEQELGVGPTQLFENIELLKPLEAESCFKAPLSSAKYSLLNFSKPQSRETLHTKSSISDHTRTFIGRKLAL